MALWNRLYPILNPDPGGRPTADLREVYNVLSYCVRASIRWPSLPHDLPLQSRVYDYFRTWCNDGWPHAIAPMCVGQLGGENGLSSRRPRL